MRRRELKGAFLITLVAAIIAAVALAVPAQSKKDRERAKNLLVQADKAMAQKDYRAAADAYGQAILITPNNPVAHFRKGHAHYYLKEYDPAIAEFTAAMNQGFKPIVEVYRIRAIAYYEQKNYDLALEDVKKGLALAPRDAQLLKNLGEVYMTKGDIPQAITALKNASQVLPNDADVHYNLARAYFTSGDTKGQEAEARAALSMGTRFVGEAYYLQADAEKKAKNNTAALVAFEKAINAKSDLPVEAYRDLAYLYRLDNRLPDAIKVLKQGILIYRDNGQMYTDLSWYHSLNDQPDRAVEAARSGIQLLPNQYLAYTTLCRAYNDTKNFDMAISACNTALKLKPGDGETHFYLARAYDFTKRTAEATRNYASAVKGLSEYMAKNPDYPDGWYLLGNAYFADDQTERAVDAYSKALALIPKFPRARYNLGLMYLRTKNKPAATEQYNALMGLDPKLAEQLKAQIDKK